MIIHIENSKAADVSLLCTPAHEFAFVVRDNKTNRGATIHIGTPDLCATIGKAFNDNGLVRTPDDFALAQLGEGDDWQITVKATGAKSCILAKADALDTIACTCAGLMINSFMMGKSK
jgi:hypothetical protein